MIRTDRIFPVFFFVLIAAIVTAAPDPDLTSIISKEGYVKDTLVAVFLDGPVYFNHQGRKEWKPVNDRQTFIDGDAIRTGNHGYAVLSYSTDNLLLIKPKSGIRFVIDPKLSPRVLARVGEATMLLSTRDSQSIQIEGRQGTLWVCTGEATYQSNKNHDMIKTLRGTGLFRAVGSAEAIKIPEGSAIEVDNQSALSALMSFDTRMEYDSFRRFNTYLSNFDVTHKIMSSEINYKVDSVLMNERFVSNLEVDADGYRILDPGAEPAPKSIHLRLKVTPYPRPEDRFEVYLNKDLIYALREGREGYHEVNFPLPTFPEFFIKIHYIDSLGRRERIFESRFVVFNRHRKIEEIKVFLERLSTAFSRRDTIFFRDHISREYKDWYGNTYFDFTQTIDDTLRSYRDIRLILHPHTFKFKGDLVQVNMNYRLTALTGSWNYRYEDLGSELMTISFEDGEYRIKSKAKGMFFQRMKVAVDLRQGILRGRVIDEISGLPIVDAAVRLLNTGMKTATDSMGEYIIYNIPAGKYDLEISKNGYGKTTITKVDIVPTGHRY